MYVVLVYKIKKIYSLLNKKRIHSKYLVLGPNMVKDTALFTRA